MLTKSKYDAYVKDMNEKIGAIPEPKQMKLNTDMNLTFEEHFEFQQTQAFAHASGYIDTDTAMAIYTALGESMNKRNGGWKSSVSTAEKVTITKLMQELLSLKIKMAQQKRQVLR